jgi:hypothetical protein
MMSWLRIGQTKAERPGATAGGDPQREHDGGKQSQSNTLITIASTAKLFHTAVGEAYAVVPVEDHDETWLLRSQGFKQWLVRQFYRQMGKPPGAQAFEDALGVLEAQARFDGPEYPVFTRIGQQGDVIYLDLCNSRWEVMEITGSGWRVVGSGSLVHFRRSKGMLPLPHPRHGGSLESLRDYINAGDERTWKLIVAFLIASLRPTGPYPLLMLEGEAGSAKSTTCRVLRALVDPSSAPLRTAPREERDLMIAARNTWLLSFDNISHLPPWFSDALCRLASGGWFFHKGAVQRFRRSDL